MMLFCSVAYLTGIHIIEPKVFKKRFGKNPTVDTSFLPDREREAEEDMLREKLRQEWVERQESLKNEEIEIVFSV